jgi:hypothetical protein
MLVVEMHSALQLLDKKVTLLESWSFDVEIPPRVPLGQVIRAAPNPAPALRSTQRNLSVFFGEFPAIQISTAERTFDYLFTCLPFTYYQKVPPLP